MSNTIVNDTSPEAQKILIEGYRNMTPRQKMRCITELNKMVQQLALARIQKQYGNIPEREKRFRLASLWLNRDTMIHVFGWDPEKEGY